MPVLLSGNGPLEKKSPRSPCPPWLTSVSGSSFVPRRSGRFSRAEYYSEVPSTTRYFGLILIVLGVASYMLTGRSSVTALIPAIFGAVLVICALIARNESARKHAMHAAVAIGLIGALASLGRGVPAALAGDAARPAVLSQLIMGVLLLIYVGLGVQSFIAARRAR